MKVVYRFSDGGYNKVKPYYVTKRGIFLHFIKRFADYDITIIADNVSEDTYSFLSSHIDSTKIIQTKLGNAKSFLFAAEYVITHFADSDMVYFAEDDYVYTKDAPKKLEEGLAIADYVSGYDHPDKYINHYDGGPNPFIYGGGEDTKVFVTQSTHWKLTNSFCMTFATRVKTVKEDWDMFTKYCTGDCPSDFELFTDLILRKKRKLISSIPGCCTHGETQWLAKFVDWEAEFRATL